MIEMGLNMESFLLASTCVDRQVSAKPKQPKQPQLEQKKDKDHRPKIVGSEYKRPPPFPRPVPKRTR